MSSVNQKVVTINVQPAHRAYLLSPIPYVPTPHRPAYSVFIPADTYPEVDKKTVLGLGDMLYARSSVEPIVLIGGESSLERYRWQALVGLARFWKYPLNRLLANRDVSLAVDTFRVNNQFRKEHLAVTINAIKIHPDEGIFKEDAGLENHIAEIKGLFA